MEPIRLCHPGVMGVYGKTKSGKTTFIRNLILNRQESFIFKDRPLQRDFASVWIFYGSTWQRVYDEISDLAEQEHLRVVFTKEFPVSDLEKSITPEFRPALVIVDDLEEELVDNKQFRQMVNKDSHHLDLSVVITFQNIFPGGRQSVNAQRQFDYYVFFTFPQSFSVAVKIAQLWSNKKLVHELIAIWRKWTKPRGGYILFDFHPDQKEDHKAFFARSMIFLENPSVAPRYLKKNNDFYEGVRYTCLGV